MHNRRLNIAAHKPRFVSAFAGGCVAFDSDPVAGGEAGAQRQVDARAEPRFRPASRMAVMTLHGRDHVVRVVDLSASGARVAFSGRAEPGAEVALQLLDRERVKGQVRWSRDGRIGLNFAAPIE
jgi:hypothetical protein